MRISEIKARSPRWFAPSTMDYFNSRIHGTPRTLADGSALFITSERYADEAPRYTVRRQALNAGQWEVESVGEFQAHESYADALAALKLAMPPRYWVLPQGGYSDTEADYIRADSKDHAVQVGCPDLGYLDNPGAWVYAGDRTPWTEVDPYPDFYVERGPRGGIRWERA